MPASHPMYTPIPAYEIRTQKAAIAVGAVFLALGVLGFVPGITTQYDQLAFAGHESGAHLFALFTVSVVHNLIHVAFGVAGILLGSTFDRARRFLVEGGIVYLAFFAYGLTVGHGGAADVLPVNAADNWLHLGLAVAMIALGIGLGRRPSDGPLR
jgi:hypothetical protein